MNIMIKSKWFGYFSIYTSVIKKISQTDDIKVQNHVQGNITNNGTEELSNIWEILAFKQQLFDFK